MSLDVWLAGEARKVKCNCTKCGSEHEAEEEDEFFSANITHNLNTMAEAAGIYQHLWRPDELSITKAGDLVEPLKKGLKLLKKDPERFRKFDAPNGWGMYDNFVPWVEKYLEACKEFPRATVKVSR